MEKITTLGIVDSYYQKLKDNLVIDVATGIKCKFIYECHDAVFE